MFAVGERETLPVLRQWHCTCRQPTHGLPMLRQMQLASDPIHAWPDAQQKNHLSIGAQSLIRD